MQRTSPWVTGGLGLGFGYLWGSWWPYPPLIVIPCPPPETIWSPEEVSPVAVPLPEDPSFADWAAQNPDVAEGYLEETGVAPSVRPAVEAESEVDARMAVERDIQREAVAEPAPSIEPTPNIEPESFTPPMPEPSPEPMDMPMDVPMDMPMD